MFTLEANLVFFGCVVEVACWLQNNHGFDRKWILFAVEKRVERFGGRTGEAGDELVLS